MAVKMLYRGPSSRLENLIEKIQATKEIGTTGKLSDNTQLDIRRYCERPNRPTLGQAVILENAQFLYFRNLLLHCITVFVSPKNNGVRYRER